MNKNVVFIVLFSILSSGFAAPLSETWSGSGELGYTMTSGNTENKTLVTKFGIQYQGEPWGNELSIEALRTTSRNENHVVEETADQFSANNKVTYTVSKDLYNFLNGRYEQDEFSSFKYQSTITVGIGWKAVKSTRTQLNLETGIGYLREKTDIGDTENGGVVRFYERLKHQINTATHLTQSVLIESGQDNTFSTLDLGIHISASRALALKLSYQIKHNTDAPDQNSAYDRITTATWVYHF